MYHFRNISFRIFVLILVMPLELVGVIFSSFGTAIQTVSQAIGEGLFSMMLGEVPPEQDPTKLMDLKKTLSPPDKEDNE